MALGCSVVGFPTGALPEVLSEGRGFLAPDVSPSALALALREALSDAQARRRVGEAARVFAEQQFSPDVVGARYLEVYGR
jgi:glycosyltransferase involved in cell wall biosynthesis